MIFTPYHFSFKTAKNRIVLAPLTNMQSNDDGTLSDAEYHWLVRRAKEGFGIIITCASNVSPDGKGWKGELGIFDDAHLPGLTRLASGIKQFGSLAIVQIFHGGARSPEEVTGNQPWSASQHTMTLSKTPVSVREGTLSEIERVKNDFVAAAHRAFKAGFDGVELHGAHGYLLHQFLSTATNHRQDQYGGTFQNRAKLLLDIFCQIKTELPPDFIVGVRLSPEDKLTFKGIDFDEMLLLSDLLAKAEANYIHLSPWDAFKKPDKYPNQEKTIVRYFRDRLPTKVAVMVAGGIWTKSDAEVILNTGADFIALGKAAIGLPDWPSRAEAEKGDFPRPPFTIQQLQAADLSDSFIGYMKKWSGFVASE
jgi:2,4-dienoyl-CoA reductase-like NADH-dependent reductase (Old Yellow Enzyme family)